MNDFGTSESTDMIEYDRCCLNRCRRLGGEQLNPSGESINDNKYILVIMSIFGQWSDMIQMKNFKWIIGRTSKSMSSCEVDMSTSSMTSLVVVIIGHSTDFSSTVQYVLSKFIAVHDHW